MILSSSKLGKAILSVYSSRPSETSRFDRFRMAIKGTWKDENLPGAGLVYDLGVHLTDQVVSLFGKPAKVTGFVENVRGIGHPDVGDAVSTDTYPDKSKIVMNCLVYRCPSLSNLKGSKISVDCVRSRAYAFGTRPASPLRCSRHEGDVCEVRS